MENEGQKGKQEEATDVVVAEDAAKKEQKSAEPQIDFAQDPSKVIKHFLSTADCPIRHVTVFNDRAEVVRIITGTYDEGAHQICISGISSHVVKESIRVAGGVGDAVILEVSDRINYSQKPKEPTDMTVLIAQKEELEKDKAKVGEQMARIEKRVQYLEKWMAKMLEPRVATVEKEADSSAVLLPLTQKSLSDFLETYESQLAQLDDRKSECKANLKDLDKKISRVNGQISARGNPPSEAVREVTVDINVTKKGKIQLELNYLITNAKWSASYDARVNSKDSSLQLAYYGVITNNSGEEWKEVEMSLSTATPSVGGTPPTLPTSKVAFKSSFTPPFMPSSSSVSWGGAPPQQQMLSLQSRDFASDSLSRRESAPMPPPPKPVEVLTTTVDETASSASFSIPRPATIESDNVPHKVTITILNLEPRFTFSTVPKLSPHVYRKATTTNSSKYPLLAGPMNVFLDNNFVATSSIKQVSANEDFALFLGTDDDIKVKYSPMKTMKEKQGMITKINSETVQRSITVKNNKAVQVSVVVYDQLPQSSDEKIKVKLIEPDLKKEKETEVKLNDSNNLEWRRKISPGKKQTIELHYVIEWPQNKEIEVHTGI